MNVQVQAMPMMYATFMNAPAAVSARATATPAAPPTNPFGTYIDVLTISPEAQERYDTHLEALGGECSTCAARVYVCSDGSVSRPTPGQAAAYVAAHERAHLNDHRTEAFLEGDRVVSQSISVFSATCPECGVIYVSGGEARSLIASETSEGGGCMPGGACCGCGCCGESVA